VERNKGKRRGEERKRGERMERRNKEVDHPKTPLFLALSDRALA
jgi:hypothetical protein